ncbi:hypothetical protein C5B41_17105, partial [Acinetobacter ursingii]
IVFLCFSLKRTVRVLDLPVSVCWSAIRPEEAITLDVCLGKNEGECQKDAFVCVVDATSLKLHLGVVLEVLKLGRPV